MCEFTVVDYYEKIVNIFFMSIFEHCQVQKFSTSKVTRLMISQWSGHPRIDQKLPI